MVERLKINSSLIPTSGMGVGVWTKNGIGLSNTQVGGTALYAVSARFKAPKDGKISKVLVYYIWTSAASSGYHAGTGGVQRIRLCADDGTVNHYPNTGSVLATSDTFSPSSLAGWPATATGANFQLMNFATPAQVTKGTLYHLVFDNTDASPAANFVSMNSIQQAGLVSPQFRRWATDAEMGLMYNGSGAGGTGGVWAKRSLSNSLAPIHEIRYKDGSCYGFGIMESWDSGGGQTCSGAQQLRQAFVPSMYCSIKNGYLFCWKSAGNGALTVTLKDDAGIQLGSATIADPGNNTEAEFAFDFGRRIDLTPGRAYFLVLSSSATWSFVPVRHGSTYAFTQGSNLVNCLGGGCQISTDSGATWSGVTYSAVTDRQEAHLQFWVY